MRTSSALIDKTISYYQNAVYVLKKQAQHMVIES